MRALTYLEMDIPEFASYYTKVLMHFDGADEATVFTDSNPGGSAHTWANGGGSNAKIDNAQSKFGGTSFKCFDTADWIETDAHADFNLGSGDFTIDFWFYTGGAGRNAIAGQTTGVTPTVASSAWYIELSSLDKIKALVYVGSTTYTVTGTTSFTTGGWHHVALVRDGGTLRLYIDGVQEASTAISGTVNASTDKLAIGSMSANTAGVTTWDGWLDEFRMTVGLARWKNGTTFAVPTAAEGDTTLRFAIDNGYLPGDISAIPSMTSVAFTPATVSIGSDLGQRATLKAVFKDHRHIFLLDSYSDGTFWGKFRARYGNKLRGKKLRWINGLEGQSLSQMETRRFIIESVEGPFPNGTYAVVAKDALKFADDDRALAPVPSTGQLNTTMTTSTTSVNLTPSGVGNLEYAASGYINIGGTEICSFTRSADALTLTRAQLGTVAVAHAQGERMQTVLRFSGVDPATIIKTLLVDYADVPAEYINESEWLTETGAFYQRVMTANIAEPTGVNALVSEIIEQAALIVWWDDLLEKIKLQVIRPIATNSDTFDESNTIEGSLKITEQPQTRVSQVYTYFNQRDPLKGIEGEDNFLSAALTVDLAAQSAYGMSVKTILSRWIPSGGRTTALRLNDLLLARFKDGPRKFNLDLFRYGEEDPVLAGGYKIGSWCLQDILGAAVTAPVQVTRLNPVDERIQIEAQEMLITSASTDDFYNRTIVIDADQHNVNMRTLHDSLFTAPDGVTATTITCIIESGVVVGSNLPTDGSTPQVSFDVGTWPAATTLNLIINGMIIGHGGNGGQGGANVNGNAFNGKQGGTALYTRKAIAVTNNNAIKGGGGGGGGGGGVSNSCGGGGGGGTGEDPGAGGPIGSGGANPALHPTPGATGLPDGTGLGGNDGRGDTPLAGGGGAGGDYGTAGANGQAGGGGATGGTGGAAGNSIDGVSFVTMSGSGSEVGPQIN